MKRVMENKIKENVLVGKKVLLVEDDKTNCFLMEKLLKAKGIEITCVMSGEEGLDLLLNNAYDLALVDINLGPNNMNGYELIKAYKSAVKSSTVIVALTAYAMEMDREKIMQSGFDAFFTKPINFNEFIAFITGLVSG